MTLPPRPHLTPAHTLAGPNTKYSIIIVFLSAKHQPFSPNINISNSDAAILPTSLFQCWIVGGYFVLCKLMSHDSISSYFLTLPTMQHAVVHFLSVLTPSTAHLTSICTLHCCSIVWTLEVPIIEYFCALRRNTLINEASNFK